MPADAVLLAIGQASDLSLLPDDETVVQCKGVVQHDPVTLMTGRSGLFVAGDVAGAGGFVVDAIASGLQVARSVDRHLLGVQGVAEPVKQPMVQLGDDQVAERLNSAAPKGTPRVWTRSTLPDTLLGDFEETTVGLSEGEAIAEAARCLNCGLCSECLACVQACPAGAISHQVASKTFEIEVDVALWIDGSTGLENLKVGVGNSGFLVMEEGADPPKIVDRALTHLGIRRTVTAFEAAAPARVDLRFAASNGHPRIGVFLCRCGGEIERVVDLSRVAARVMSTALPGLVYVDQVEFACHPEGNQAIRSAMTANDLDGAVLAACSCCSLDQICYSCTTQRIRCKERLGVWDDLKGLPLSFVNLREHCAFVHREDPSAATTKAGDMVAASVAGFALAERITEQCSPEMGGSYPRIPIMASIDTVRCRGCEDCETICGLDAIKVVNSDGARIAQVEAMRCLGCGVCMAVCSSGAVLAGDTSDAQAAAMLRAMGDLGDKTVVFSCNWGAYSAVEAAGVEGLSYDPSVRLVRMMCAGRAHEGLILRAFSQGAARVLVLACGYEGDTSQCHYHTGNDQARRSVQQAQRLLGLLGIDSARLALAELRPGDGAKFVMAVEQLSK
jgi:coenzyme F420-reducing hydrogenase delta subunit/ferredoxin